MLKAWILNVFVSLLPPTHVQPRWQAESHETVEEIQQRYDATATDLAEVLSTEKPLFKGPKGLLQTAALVASVIIHESTLRKAVDTGQVLGDGGKSWCLMQVNVGEGQVLVGNEELRSWYGKDLVADRKKCFRAGLAVLRARMYLCRSLAGTPGVISGYIHGSKCLPDDERSFKRWEMAQRMLRRWPRLPKEVVPPPALALGG